MESMLETKICLKCGSSFAKKYGESTNYWNRKKYCSQNCANSVTASRTRLVEYVKTNGSWNKGKKRPDISGSNHPNWKEKITCQCEECGKLFEVSPSRSNKARFCSKLCDTNNRNHGKTSEHEAIRKSAAYRLWRTSVFERDNYTCQDCGARCGNGHAVVLHADHIKPFAIFPELRLDPSNGRTLCSNCHKKTITYGRAGMFRNSINVAQEV
jgi:5-methylcytosine-specific restriction endonuclease McrA